MDLQKFKESYKQVISESNDDSEIRAFIRSIVEEIVNEKKEESCWGCGFDWKENGWSSDDLAPADSFDNYKQFDLEPEDKICPDCIEELGIVEESKDVNKK